MVAYREILINGVRILLMKNLKIGPRLFASFLLLTVFTLVLGIMGIISSTTLSAQVSSMYDEPVTAIKAISVMRGRFNNIRLQVLEFASAADDPDKAADYIQKIDGYKTDIENAMATYEGTITDKEKETDYYSFKDQFTAYMSDVDKIKAAADDGGSAAALAAFEQYHTDAEDALTLIENISDYNESIASALDKSSDDIALGVLIAQIAIIVIAIAAAVIIALSTTKSISTPIGYVTKILKEIGTKGRTSFTEDEWAIQKKLASGSDETAECAGYLGDVARALNGVAGILDRVSDGDLTIEHKAMSEDDVISTAIIKMLASLNKMFDEINQAAEQVSLGGDQISDASQHLAEGSTEQAATVEELSASVQNIAEKTKQNAIGADEASQMSVTVKQNAEKGADQMSQMTAAVSEINQASQDISKVIKVIDDIAFQTNILALNAAVEAARAGEAGKGFAVVADEVRNLASKSAAAAKETGVLIENSMKKAELGSSIAAETAESLSEIVDGINKQADLIAEIADSSKEQSIAISQINDGIMQVSEVVQKNSATAEECAASAEELNAQSTVLTENIAQFKLKN
jgi:methyl-accepting chemotaxis protein